MDFVKGNIAGYIGAIAVYPIDLIKSNMQLQTLKTDSYDYFGQIVRKQGFTKLYMGSFIQIISVGPEKNVNPIIAGLISGLFDSVKMIGGIKKLYRGQWYVQCEIYLLVQFIDLNINVN